MTTRPTLRTDLRAADGGKTAVHMLRWAADSNASNTSPMGYAAANAKADARIDEWNTPPLLTSDGSS